MYDLLKKIINKKCFLIIKKITIKYICPNVLLIINKNFKIIIPLEN